MTTLLTPGLYRQPVEPVRTAGRLARADIPVVMGYARRGPLSVPVRVHSLAQFEEIFGAPPAHGFLWPGLKGFFETGGQTAYVLRIAHPSARRAAVDQRPEGAFTWRAEASFPWPMIDPKKLNRAERAEAATWIGVFERQVREHGPRSPDPGSWANTISLSIRRTARVRTETLRELVADGFASRLASLAGIEAASVLELSQTGADEVTRSLTKMPARIDRQRQLVYWDAPLSAMPDRSGGTIAFDPLRPIRVTSVEFDVEVYAEGKLEQAFSLLSPNPAHSFAISQVMRPGSRSLDLVPVVRRKIDGVWEEEEPEHAADALAAIDWSDPEHWPDEGSFALSGGTDGLEEVKGQTWLDALPQIARLPDAALIAAPDLVLPAADLPVAAETPGTITDCSDLAPPPLGHLSGKVTFVDDDGQEADLPGVSVDIAGPGGQAVTDSAGLFAVSGIAVDLLTVRLSKTGFEPLEHLAQSSPFASTEAVRFIMTRITAPRALLEDEVLGVQQAMANPEIVGPYKVAIVDPPRADAKLDELKTWRARLGDSNRLGYFAPWLQVPLEGAPGGLLACPPSGHVCGAFAAAEAAHGLHRTGANRLLRFVEGTTLAITDADQAGLNPVGVNAIRAFPGRGIRVFGTRSLSSDPEWQFLTARRIVDAIEKMLERALAWMVFEPNNLMTRHAVATTATTLLNRLWRDGILAGAAPEAAYAAKCDLENNPDEGREAGRLVVDVAVAPTNPYEFVLFRLGHAFDAVQVTEMAP
jgi:uncharacterized protein